MAEYTTERSASEPSALHRESIVRCKDCKHYPKRKSEIKRVQMRGKPLEPMCYKAQISNNEYHYNGYDFAGCYGMYDMMTEEPTDECERCGAFVHGDFISRAKKVVKE